MLKAAALVVLGLFPAYAVGQLLTTDAKCLSGYEWMFSSVSQSPCDVAAELAGVCVGGQFNLKPLDQGYVYLGPTQTNANSCRCSSVYYSLLSACAHCQSRNYIRWSGYTTNCTTVYNPVYPNAIPEGVKVPAWAYQDVSVGDNFNVTLAMNTRGTESTRLPSSSTSRGSSSTSARTGAAANNPSTNVGAIVGGVVGGLVGLGLIGGLIAFFVIRRRKSSSKSAYTPAHQSPNMAFTPNTTASLIPHSMSPPPGSPVRVYDPNDPSTYPVADPNSQGTYSVYGAPGSDPYRQQSPFGQQNLTSQYTGNSQIGVPSQNIMSMTGQTIPPTQNMMHTGRSQYSGAPEL